jgi:hypothetical protein
MTDKTEIEVLTVDIPSDTESRRYEFRESRRLHAESRPRHRDTQRHTNRTGYAPAVTLARNTRGRLTGIRKAVVQPA